MVARVLVIAYGNPLRSDDGAAWHAAEALHERCPSAKIVSAHQLTPEFAEMAAKSVGVVFIDAAQNGDPGQIVCAWVHAEEDRDQSSHWLTPAQLVALCEELYGVTPRAMMISIAGASFDHGDTLSEALRSALPELIDQAEEWVLRLADSSQNAGLSTSSAGSLAN
jgi:hydrogenase maturation protease